jgi:gluconate 5-dehydrogenase
MVKELFDLTGKTALVTGASHGLGMAIAIGLGKAGANIVVNSTSGEKLDRAKTEYARNQLDVKTYVFDVTNESEVIHHLNIIEKEAEPVDILVNNAGIIKRVPLADMQLDDWKKVIDVDLTGPFIMGKNVAKRMIERKSGGKIINICSMMSELGRDTVGAYAAAKGGLKMLTRNMATEWARYNIQVNGIGPGYFATSQTAPLQANGHPFNDFIVSRTPAGRWGNPEDLVGSAIFLASKASDFVTGHILYVDGGILATIGKPANEP